MKLRLTLRKLTRLLSMAAILGMVTMAAGQDTQHDIEDLATPKTAEDITAKVDVAPESNDAAIAARLTRILDATGWFTRVEVRVDEGVVFLTGTARDDDAKQWAGKLAGRTQDVVAVVNKLNPQPPELWDLQPAVDGVRLLWRDALGMVPFFAFSLIILAVSWLVARITIFAVRRWWRGSDSTQLLRDVSARAIGFIVFVIGIYIVLRVSGLTRLALTVVGGTGILGLVIGIAFRDITENYLASIVLSMRRPFLTGDLVEIADVLGYVQRLNTRTTVLMTLSGNHVEIPNAKVYNSTIHNFTTNDNRRSEFTIGIGYDVAIADAQEVALQVLRDHEAVLKDPEPWVLVDSLGAAVVTLKVYFWIDGRVHSWLKVKSSVIRLVKRAFQEAQINMPDEAREVVFPRGVPIQMVSKDDELPAPRRAANAKSNIERQRSVEPLATSAESDLSTDAQDIGEQARNSRKMGDDNLLNRSNAN